MLHIDNITVDFGTRILFQEINLVVKPTDKIGLAGRNGMGKSTLLKIIAKQQSPSQGQISHPSNYTIGYLPQELSINSTETIFDEAKSALSGIEQLEQQQEKITEQITTRTDYESDAYMQLIVDLNKVNDQLHAFGSHQADQKVEEILKGLGFTQQDLSRPINTFSGGWQMRVELAKLLLQSPDLLLLDEPTNHLDIESIIWLEQFLIKHSGALIMVSHDRQFLDAITNRTVEIINQKIEDYRAPYSKFLELREERLEKLYQAQKNQEREIDQMEQNINKFRAKKNKAKFAQTLIRKLEKMDRIEIDNYDQKNMSFSFQVSRRSAKEVLKANKVSKSYGEKQVISNFSLEILRGDRVAFVGKNGMGKSTLAKMIVGDTDYEGELETGVNVELGYYAQHQNNSLDERLTVLETIEKEAPKEYQGRERALLGSFLFSGEDVDKKVKVLSGGEKARLALAKMIMKPTNVLILDEPTNHLDLQSKEILKHALELFEGTLIIVSHDRNFLSNLTDKVFEFTENGIKEHLGDVNYFLQQKGADNFREFEQKEKQEISEQKTTTKNNQYLQNKEHQKLIKSKERDIQKIEQQIMNIEEDLELINSQLQDPEFYQEVSSDLSFFDDYDTKKKKLQLLYAQFEEQIVQLDELKK